MNALTLLLYPAAAAAVTVTAWTILTLIVDARMARQYGSMDTKKFMRYLNKVPRAYTHDTNIVLQKGRIAFNFKELLEFPSGIVAGRYDRQSKTIILRHMNAKRMLLALYHELGHHLWYQHATEPYRVAWSKLETPPVSEYATTNVMEDFAENFCIAHSTHKHLVHPKKMRMIQALISKVKKRMINAN